ncbi:MAG: hypothetical protein JW757_07140 [Anaerolineales bacterium]|nr:hypothetical protein [Anaerolineales bacterium]
MGNISHPLEQFMVKETMRKQPRNIFFLAILLTTLAFLTACGTTDNAPQAPPQPNANSAEENGEETNQPPEPETQPAENTPQMNEEEIQAAIQVSWNNSPHAAAYVLDEANQNNSCARCHSPINWQPTLDDLPESCFSCKFELEEPDPLIAENDWQNIPCMVCHEVGRKDKVDPAFKWLEIAELEEYTQVETSTELCQKCHPTETFTAHGGIQDLGVHQDMTCTDCHDAHTTQASCMDAGCHENVLNTGIPGHTDEHLNVACVACHDAGGMALGFREEDGLFTTQEVIPTEEGENTFFFSSHHLKLDSACDDCHFTGNPWSITDNIGQ